MSDPGKICLQGWTPGQLNRPKFNWVKNLSKKISSDIAQILNMDICAAFALFWNLTLQKIPPEIIQDFEKCLLSTDTPRMQYDSTIPSFTLKLQHHHHTFHQQKFAPPSGQTSYNYCRYMHTETNGTRYMVLWYTHRNFSKKRDSVCNGGHFFFGDYGVRVQNFKDTAISWEPRKAHGTSLYVKKYPFEQRGMSIGISNRLATVWKKLKLEGQPMQNIDEVENYDEEIEE